MFKNRINLFLLLIVMFLFTPINCLAEESLVNSTVGTTGGANDTSGSEGTVDPTKSNGYYHGVGYTGVRITIVDEDGKKIPGTRSVDYYSVNMFYGNNKKLYRLSGDTYRTSKINGSNTILSTKEYAYFANGYIYSDDPSSVLYRNDPTGGLVSKMENWETVNNYLASVVKENVAKYNKCEDVINNTFFFKDAGFNPCKNENFDCKQIEKTYILIEPLLLIHLDKKEIIITAADADFIHSNYYNSYPDLKDLAGGASGVLSRHAYGSMFFNTEGTDYKLNSKGDRYGLFADKLTPTDKDIYEGCIYKRCSYGNGVWGNGMQAVWLTKVIDNCKENCCVPCSVDPTNPNCDLNDCCVDEGLPVSTDGTTEACKPWKDYWDERGDYDAVCLPKCDPNTDPNGCCYDEEYLREHPGYYEEFCSGDKCPPLHLNGTSYCGLANCDGVNNVSVFADPVLSEFVKDGSTDTNKLIDKFSNLTGEQIKSLIAYEDNSFIAVAEVGGEMYKKTINQYCDLYCQEVAVVTLPDVYPAANAGRYFQWGISNEEPGTIVTQKIIKICAEDIKYDNLILDYINFDSSLTRMVNRVTGYRTMSGCCAGSVKDALGVGSTCSQMEGIELGCCYDKCATAYNACMSGCTSRDAHGNVVLDSACVDGCVESFELCKADCDDIAPMEPLLCQQSVEAYNIMMANLLPGTEMKEDFISEFDAFLECFSDNIDGEIATDLNINLWYDNNVLDSSYYEKEDGKVIRHTPKEFYCEVADDCNWNSYFSVNSILNSAAPLCVGSQLLPREAYDKIEEAVVAVQKAGQLKEEIRKIQQEISNLANKKSIIPTINVSLKLSNDTDNGDSIFSWNSCPSSETVASYTFNATFEVSDFSKNLNDATNTAINGPYGTTGNTKRITTKENREVQWYNIRKGCGDDIISKLDEFVKNTRLVDFYICSMLGDSLKMEVLRQSLPMCKSYYDLFIAGDNASASTSMNGGYCDRVADVYANGGNMAANALASNFPLAFTNFEYNKWLASPEYFTSVLAAKAGVADYKKTFRLIALEKTDKYHLKENINACTCSDGTVMDAIDDGNGNFICDCDPEISETYYGNSSNGGNASLIENDTWGRCEYSAYSKIDVGGTYTIAYMTGSGTYPLTIEYFNIGSTDEYGVGHFSNILDECGCIGGNCIYDGDACKLVVGNAIMQDVWTYEDLEEWTLKSSWFVCKNGECWDPDKYPKCPDGECPNPPSCPDGECPNPPSPFPEPQFPNEPVCPNGECVQGLSLVYRTVDLDNPFPNRAAGENWQGQESKITNNRGLAGNMLYSSNDVEPLYYFKFTPSLIKDIRAYNVSRGRDYATSSTIAYPNNRLTNDNGKYNVGISQVLRNDIGGIVAKTAVTNGDSLDKWFKVPGSDEDCREGYEDGGDGWCYEVANSWKEISSITYQGDEACWDLAKTYLGVNR